MKSVPAELELASGQLLLYLGERFHSSSLSESRPSLLLSTCLGRDSSADPNSGRSPQSLYLPTDGQCSPTSRKEDSAFWIMFTTVCAFQFEFDSQADVCKPSATMPKRSSRSKNMIQFAASILVEAVGEPAPILPDGKKNPAAVSLDRVGGLKGGKPRAASPSPTKRVQGAKKATAARRKAK